MGNLIPSNLNDDSGFDPTKINGCKIWFDATDTSTMSATDYLGSVDVPDNFVPTDINGCKTWFDSSDPNSVFATEVGPVQAVSSPLDISGCNLWLDPSDANTVYSSYAGPVSEISSPLDISGCTGWWDASDISSMFQDFGETTPVTSNNDPVAVLRDKSGSNIRAFQQTPANRPTYRSDVSNTNGKSALFFNSSNFSFLFSNRPASSTHTILAVLYPTVTLTGAASPISINALACFHPFGGELRWFSSNLGQYISGSYAFDFFPQIVGWTNNNSALTGYKNSYVAFSGTADSNINNAGLNIGRRDAGAAYFDGYICEIVYYNKVLTTSERTRVEKYLTSKWGISPIHKQSGQGERVGFIQDKSGNGYHATQVLESNRPYVSSFPQANNKGSILFNKAQATRLNVTNYPGTYSQNFTIFLAIKPSSLAANDVILGQNNAGCNATALWSGSAGDIRFRTAEGGQYSLYTSNLLNPTILCISRSSSTNHSLFRNGILSSTFSSIFSNTSSVADLLSNIGSSCSGVSPYEGHISEIIVYNRELSFDERGRVEKYLFAKWAFSDPHVNSSLNGPIGCWADKSGNNIHARQLTASYRPSYSGTLNGLRAITFDGTDDYFSLGNLFDEYPNFGEVFVVFEPNNSNTYHLYQSLDNWAIYNYSESSSFGTFTQNRAIPGAIAAPTSGTHVTSMRANASSMTVRLDGNNWHSQSGLGFHGGWHHHIGFSFQGSGGVGGIVMKGKIVEVITYNADMGSENRAKVEQYLAKKWGISPKLHDKVDDGKKVGYWSSKGPNAISVAQHNFSKRPILGSINGKNAVEFSVSLNYLRNNYVNFETSNNFSVFWVGRLLNNSAFAAAFRIGNMNNAAIFARMSSTLEFGGSVGLNVGKPNTVGAGFIESIVKSSGTIHNNTSAFRNNISFVGSTYGVNSELNLNAGVLVLGSYWGDTQTAGDTTNLVVGEFIFYNRALSSAERRMVEDYLYEKWRLDKLDSSISRPTEISGCILWLDANDEKTMFQDVSASLPVTADGQSVAYWADKIGGQDVVQSSSSARPTYKKSTLNGKPTVYFDGGDDLLSRATRTTTGPCTIIVVCRLDSYSGDIPGVVTYGNSTGGLGGPGIVYNGSPGIVFLDGAGSGTAASSNSNSSVLGLPRIMTAVYTQANTANSYFYLNGSLEEYFTGTGVNLTSGTNRVQIGARTGGGLSTRRMVGHIAECLIYNRALSDRERSLVENYLSNKWGMGSYSPPNNIGSGVVRHKIKVLNKEAQNWVDRVFENGGTVSQKTADAVNMFCERIEEAGLRQKFYRLNLFCGNDLSACLTPLYLGTDSDTFYGNRTESNTGFVGSDYTEKNGLTCDSHAKALLTGVSPVATGCYKAGHMAFYQTQNININPVVNNGYVMGAGISDSFKYFVLMSSFSVKSGYGGNGANLVETPYFGGLYLVSRIDDSDLSAYEQGSKKSQNASLTTTDSGSSAIVIFNTSTTGSSFNNAGFAHFGSLKGYSFGKSMTESEASTYNSIMESFQSALGRGLSARPSSQFNSVTNEDAKYWIDAVYGNGGTISGSTALAVDDFCNSIDAAGIRNKFYRLNLFCGDDINGCLVPLYRGPITLGIRYGNTRDANNNFTIGDYSETGIYGGLSGGSNKYLDTGFKPSMFPDLNDNHISIYNTTSVNIDVVRYLIGSSNTNNAGWRITTNLNATAFTCGNTGWKDINLPNNNLRGMWLMSRTSSSGFFTRLGTENYNATNASDSAGLTANNSFAIFANNQGSNINGYAGNTFGAYSLGAGLSSSEATTFKNIMDSFQTAIGRSRPSDNPTFSAVTNSEAKSWVDRVYYSRSSASPETALAVNNLCNSIDSAGLRSKIFRLNLFCGGDLSSCLVPVYTGSSYSGAISGGSIDLNNNFVSSDYSELGFAGGLKGNGSNKWLDTGLPQNFSTARHMGLVATLLNQTTYRVYMGARASLTYGNWTGEFRLQTDNLPNNASFITGSDAGVLSTGISANGLTAGYLLIGVSDASGTGANTVYFKKAASNSVTGYSTSDGTTIAIFSQKTANSNNSGNYSDGRLALYTIGTSLNSSQVSALTDIFDTFTMTMGRCLPSVSEYFSSVDNLDAKAWLDAVYDKGGTVSISTANAVNTFCKAIDAAGIRDRFSRLNLFCGDNLTACLVPLYRGTSAGGTKYGSAMDTNYFFTSADYVEMGPNGGLKGNGTSKYLDTGLSCADAGFTAGIGHISTYISTPKPAGGFNYSYLAGVTTGYLSARDGGTTLGFIWGGGGVGSSVEDVKGHVIANVDSGISRTLYVDAVSVGSSNNSNSTTPSGSLLVFNRGAQPNVYFDGRISSYSFGINLSPSQVSAYYSAMQAFQTALGRNT